MLRGFVLIYTVLMYILGAFQLQPGIDMSSDRRAASLRFLGLASLLLLLGQAAALKAAESFEVTKTFDNCPFSCRIEPARATDTFEVYRLHYPSPVRTSVEPNNTVPAELYIPRGMKPGSPKRPAVICLHILDGNEELVKISCSALAARGIPALWFNLPFYGPRSATGRRLAPESDPTLFTTAIAQAVQDVRRTVDVLAARPEIDPDRIGVMGISLGGIFGRHLGRKRAADQPRRLGSRRRRLAARALPFQ